MKKPLLYAFILSIVCAIALSAIDDKPKEPPKTTAPAVQQLTDAQKLAIKTLQVKLVVGRNEAVQLQQRLLSLGQQDQQLAQEIGALVEAGLKTACPEKQKCTINEDTLEISVIPTAPEKR